MPTRCTRKKPWSSEDDLRLRSLMKQDKSINFIADAMGRSKSSISTRAAKAGLKFKSRTVVFKGEERALILKYGKAGASTETILDALDNHRVEKGWPKRTDLSINSILKRHGINRSAVRMNAGLKRRGGGVMSPAAQARAKLISDKAAITGLSTRERAAETVAALLGPAPLMKSLMELDVGAECHWPYGDPKREPHCYCAHPIRPAFRGKAYYCDFHLALANVPRAG